MDKIQRKETQSHFLAELVNTKGSISDSAYRCGINRSTFYSWKKKYKKFSEEAEKILTEEKQKMDDYVEGKLFKLIDEGNVAAIIFYLKTRHEQYQLRHLLTMTNKWEVEGRLSPADRILIEKAINYGLKKVPKEDTGRPELPKEAGE